MRLGELLPPRVFLVLRELDSEAVRAQQGKDRSQAWIALLVSTLCLVGMEYAGNPSVLAALLRRLSPGAETGWSALYGSRWGELCDLTWWVAFRVLGFLLVPLATISFVLRDRIQDYGLSPSGLRGQLRLYLGLYALVLPVIGAAALRPEFVQYYPFYRRVSESVLDLVVWELLYALQFLSLELFFRGFLLQACYRTMGAGAIFVMIVPYCMIHFTKPLLEVLAAIPAGFVLGVLALRTRSIWGGVFLHVAVAWTMDVLAILQTSGMPSRAFPLRP
jgi:membrane protease YdiL (CAAX protease family)